MAAEVGAPVRGRYDSVALTAAITGGDTLPSQSPHIPRGAEAIIAEAVKAATAGATCVHLHARDADGKPTSSGTVFERMARGIREQCDVVLSFSTGGALGMSVEERLEGMHAGRPEIATLNLGTMNYEGYPSPERWPKVSADWERKVLERSGEGVFVNTLKTIRAFAAAMRQLGVTPELEAYDLGHLSMARFLIDEGTLSPPVRVQLVLGVVGGAGSSLDDLFLLKQAAHRLLGRDLGSLGVAAMGYPMEFRHVAVALSEGMDCRVGLEDSLRLRRSVLATSNAELVGVAVQLAELVGRPIASPAEFRKSLLP
jgi:uncharacterized protein (DUF849 family)